MDSLLEIVDAKSSGWLSWIVAEDRHSGSVRTRLDRLAMRFRVTGGAAFATPIGPGWVDVERDIAELCAGNAAKGGIAYNSKPLRPGLKHADVTRFFARFGADSRVLTNWTPRRGTNGASWVSLTGSTFDMGFGVVDGPLTGMFCIEDED